MLQVSKRYAQAAIPSLSIPSRMLLANDGSCYIVPNLTTFNSFQDASGFPNHSNALYKKAFQFLLGCFITMTTIKVQKYKGLSIPSRMLQGGDCYYAIYYFPLFQFLLGCFLIIIDEAHHTPANTFNSFQDASGKKGESGKRRGKNLSIPSRMLHRGLISWKLNTVQSFNSFQDASVRVNNDIYYLFIDLSIPSRMLPLSLCCWTQCPSSLSIPSRMLHSAVAALLGSSPSFNSFQDASRQAVRQET